MDIFFTYIGIDVIQAYRKAGLCNNVTHNFLSGHRLK